jgi:hypothetical protein
MESVMGKGLNCHNDAFDSEPSQICFREYGAATEMCWAEFRKYYIVMHMYDELRVQSTGKQKSTIVRFQIEKTCPGKPSRSRWSRVN